MRGRSALSFLFFLSTRHPGQAAREKINNEREDGKGEKKKRNGVRQGGGRGRMMIGGEELRENMTIHIDAFLAFRGM